MTRFYRINKGFTLIELLVVIAVVGVLAGAVVVIINPAAILDRARIAKAKNFQGNLTTGPLNFYNVGAWNFNDATTPGLDISGNNNNGILSGGVSYTASCDLGLEGCLSFDGINGYVLISDNYLLDIGTGNKTWAMWFKTSNSARGIMYRKSDGSNSNGVLIDINNTPGQLRCYVSNNGATVNISVTSTQNTWNDDTWHYLACVLDRASNKLYLYTDGELNNSLDSSSLTGDLNAAGGAQIGQGGGFFFSGKIDEFYIFSQSISQAMIQQFFARGAVRHFLVSNNR